MKLDRNEQLFTTWIDCKNGACLSPSLNWHANIVSTIYLAQYTYSYISNINLYVQSAMKLYIYQGLENEKVPKDVTHVIVASSVTVIKEWAFSHCELLVCVIMGDNVKRIEARVFSGCRALQFVRLSKTLEYIGEGAFTGCESLEVLFLPSTVTSIGYDVFWKCVSLRLLILPNDIDLDNV